MIKEFIHSISPLFDVQNYTILITHCKEDREDERFADIVTDHTYRKLRIKTYPKFLVIPKWEQQLTLIHEMCHTTNEDMYECWENMYEGKFVSKQEALHYREKNTEQMAMIIYKLATGKAKYVNEAIKKYKSSK